MTMPYPREMRRQIRLASISLNAVKKTQKAARGSTRFPESLYRLYSRNIRAHSIHVTIKSRQK